LRRQVSAGESLHEAVNKDLSLRQQQQQQRGGSGRG